MSTTNSYEALKEDPAQLIALLAQRDREIEKLQLAIHNSNRKQYGKKSEKLSKEQRALFTFEPLPEPEPQQIEVAGHKRIIPRGRKPIAASIPRERVEYEPEDRICSCCGLEMAKIGEEITEELEYIPAQFKVIEHVRIKRACSTCQQGVATGVLPDSVQPLGRSRPGAGLLTQIALSKYVDHVPLFRQEQIFARHGIELSRKRMCDWLGRVADEYLVRLWNLLKAETLCVDYVQADETTVKVRDLEVMKEKEALFTGYFWAVHAPPGLVFFEYHATRAATAAKSLLQGFTGIVQTDAYAGYNPVMLPDKVTRLACMAHIRRKFIEARKAAPKECDLVLVEIARLYRFESNWKDITADQRTELRQRHAKPIFDRLQDLLQDLTARMLPQHDIQKALKYAINQRDAMALYLTDGRLRIDNNLIEGRIRPVAIGRKNYLFAGSHAGAKRAAILYSLLACCKLNNVNPHDWLCDILKKMPAYPVNKLDNLLPHRWKMSSL